MSALPAKRLAVYLATGTVVLVAGVLGLLAMKGTSGGEGTPLIDVVSNDAVDGGGLALDQGGGFADVREGFPSTTTTTESRRIWVQVAGAVVRPGVYYLTAGTRVFQAVAEAGGPTEEAEQDAVAMAAELFDGCRVYVPRVGEVALGTIVSPTGSSAGVTGGSSGGSKGLVSLNTATVEQLDTLPGIGPALAAQIVAYRESQGPFTSVDQLTDVPGIGAAKLEQLRPLVGL